MVAVKLLDENQKILSRAQYEAVEEDGVWRLRYYKGVYVEENLGEILLEGKSDTHHSGTGVEGIEISKMVYKNFNGWPINILKQFGITNHKERDSQGDFTSVTLGIRAEWTSFPWNNILRAKLEFMEGVNYAQRVPYYEGKEVRADNNGRDSKFLNYLGLGIGVNLGDLLQIKEAEKCYVGGYVYHRSGVFATVDSYNNVSGGSNFKTIYIECAH